MNTETSNSMLGAPDDADFSVKAYRGAEVDDAEADEDEHFYGDAQDSAAKPRLQAARR